MILVTNELVFPTTDFYYYSYKQVIVSLNTIKQML